MAECINIFVCEEVPTMTTLTALNTYFLKKIDQDNVLVVNNDTIDACSPFPDCDTTNLLETFIRNAMTSDGIKTFQIDASAENDECDMQQPVLTRITRCMTLSDGCQGFNIVLTDNWDPIDCDTPMSLQEKINRSIIDIDDNCSAFLVVNIEGEPENLITCDEPADLIETALSKLLVLVDLGDGITRTAWKVNGISTVPPVQTRCWNLSLPIELLAKPGVNLNYFIINGTEYKDVGSPAFGNGLVHTDISIYMNEWFFHNLGVDLEIFVGEVDGVITIKINDMPDSFTIEQAMTARDQNFNVEIVECNDQPICSVACIDANGQVGHETPEDGVYFEELTPEYNYYELGSITDGPFNCASRLINFYRDQSEGPFYFAPDDSSWHPLITTLFVAMGYGPNVATIQAFIPDLTVATFQYSTDSGVSWIDGPTFTQSELASIVDITGVPAAFRWRLKVKTSDKCEYYSAENTLIE